jgi:hypothetical protein
MILSGIKRFDVVHRGKTVTILTARLQAYNLGVGGLIGS